MYVIVGRNGFWLYSDSDMSLVVEIKDKTSLGDISLVRGWNIVPVTYDMSGKSIDQISGECGIERVFGWDEYSQEWDALPTSYKFTEKWVGRSILVRSSNYCNFNYGMLPPPMPE